jgi:hypothetical protein
MKKIRQTISVALAIAFASISMVGHAQSQRPYRSDDRAIQQLLQRIETDAGRFRTSVSEAMDRSRLDNTQREDNVNQLVADLEQSTSQLRDRFTRRQSTTSDVQSILDRAARIDNFMQRRRLGGVAETDWTRLRSDLDQLANYYNISWNWNNVPGTGNRGNYGGNRGNSGGNRGNYVGDARLTGTYRLDASESTNARDAVENAVRNLPAEQRQRATEGLLRRMEAPEVLAIERRGRTFTLASSRAPQATFDADGQEHVEESPNGRGQTRTRVNLSGDQLTINTTGNRATDYSITFEPVNNGNELRVTRRLYSDRFTQPVVVESRYDRTSDVAQLDIYTGAPSNSGNYPNSNNYPSTGSVSNSDYIVPDGMTLVARLNDNLATTSARSGDRFTMTVVSPAEYEGATVEGFVGDVDRGGRVTGRSQMALNLERIRMRNGRTYRFEGTIESVRAANGETIRVDNEGSVQENNQTNRTIKRTAIGTAIGAVLGAVIGGGSGAAVGAVVGAGAGAGSVYVQGRNDLEMTSGTEMTIRASAPRSTSGR